MNLFLAENMDEVRGTLGAEESHHASRVLRLSSGAHILVTLGTGRIYEASISEISKKNVSFNIVKLITEDRSNRHLTIAIAPTKSNDRFENFLEKATELGIQRIVPLICKNSERRLYKTERGLKAY